MTNYNLIKILRKIKQAKDCGFDMLGPGQLETGRGFRCDCSWSSKAHGQTCPEHGEHGICIKDLWE